MLGVPIVRGEQVECRGIDHLTTLYDNCTEQPTVTLQLSVGLCKSVLERRTEFRTSLEFLHNASRARPDEPETSGINGVHSLRAL